MRKLFLIANVFMATVAQAELKGVVYEKGRKVKLSGINVYVPEENLSATTAKDGSFSLPVQQEQAELKINASGFLPYTRTYNNNSEIVIYLERKPVKGGSLSLTVEDTNYKKDQAVKSLNRQQIFDMPGANGDPVKAVQNLPGVNRVQGFSSQVIIQGSAPKDTAYDFEGHEIPIVFHFGGLTSVVMPEAVEKVDYYSAGYQAERSRALGGVISLAARKPEVNERDSKGLFYMDTLSAGGLFESKINDKQSILISGRYSYITLFLKAVMRDTDQLNFTVAPEFYDTTAIYNYQLAENENFKISFVNSNDRLAFVLKEPVRHDPSIRGNFSNSINFFRLVPQWEKQIDADNFLKLSLGYGVNRLNFDIGDNYFDSYSQNISTRARWEHKLADGLMLNTGWDNLYSDVNFKSKFPLRASSGGVSNPISGGEVREADIRNKSYSLGLFTELDYQMTPQLKVTPGLRGDYFSLTRESFLLPRLAAQYKVNDSLLLKSTAGMYAQAAESSESSADFGNEDIKSPQAFHFTLGFDTDFKKGSQSGHSFGMNGFYKKFNNLVVQTSKKTIKNGVEKFQIYSNEGSGNAYGIENSWKYTNDDYQFILAYTLSKSTRNDPLLGEYDFQYDQTHNVNIIGIYPLPADGWKISGRYRYVTGNPYTPVVSSVYDADNEIYFPIRGPIYSERNKSFQQLDLRVDKKIISDQSIWTFYIDIQNVLNIENSEGVQYSYDYSVKQEVTGLPFLPAIGIRGEF